MCKELRELNKKEMVNYNEWLMNNMSDCFILNGNAIEKIHTREMFGVEELNDDEWLVLDNGDYKVLGYM